MSDELRKVLVRMEAETARYQRDLDKSRKETSRWRKQAERDVSDVGKVFRNLAAAAGIALLTKKVIDATAAQEAAVKQLEQGWKSTGGTVGLTVAEMTRHAADLQKVSLFGDEQIIDAQAKLVTFTNIAGEQFKKATVAALDLSSRMGTDLNSSVLQIGKALNDPVAGLTALTRSGIQFSDAQKDVIKSLVETGEKAKAQEIILAELETQFGGSAAAARDTFGGAIKGLSNAFADLFEAGDGLDDTKESIEGLTAILQDPETVAVANALASALIKGFAKAGEMIAGAVKMAKWAGEEIAALVHGPAMDDVNRIQQQVDKQQQKIDQWRARVENSGGVGAAFELKKAQEEMDVLNQKLKVANDLVGSYKNDAPVMPSTEVGGSGVAKKNPEVAMGISSDLQGLIDKQRDYYAQIHEEALRADGMDVELENLRFERQKTRLEEEYELLRSKGAVTQQITNEQNQALYEAERAHQLNLADIEDEKTKKLEEEALKRKDFQQQTAQMILGFTAQQLSITTDMLAQSGKENSALYKALFLVQKAAAIPSMIVSTEQAATGALAAFPGPVGLALSAATRALGYASVGIVAGQAVAGIAHGGLDYVPSESTYLLDKGERVLSPSQNSDLTRFLDQRGSAVSGGESVAGGAPVSIFINGVASQPDRDEVDGNIRRVILNEVSSKSTKTMRALQSQTNVKPKGNY
ncbi:phage tail length tape measure family protein [Zhongshania guokunii]|uniref:Phage tail length tape measure family protein n=1 Tax=Zhongshania guokunii TaxID=641783 RepID=A0ABV3U6J1_9GAMM